MAKHRDAPTFKRIVRSDIRPADAGRALLDLLATRFTYLSRDQWAETIDTGRIQINGRDASRDATKDPKTTGLPSLIAASEFDCLSTVGCDLTRL